MTETSFQPVHGQCECGAVRFEVHARARELYHCHCERCRRLHGCLFATYAYVLRKEVTVTRGANATTTYRSPTATWQFCSTCGCHLFAEHEHNPGAMWYMPATLDGQSVPGHPDGSEKHIFAASKSPLDVIADDKPQYQQYAPAEVSITSRRPADPSPERTPDQ